MDNLPFDPATGDWRGPAAGARPSTSAPEPLQPWPEPTQPAPAAVNLEAPRKDRVARIWNAILGIDIGLLVLFFLLSTILALIPSEPDPNARPPTTSQLQVALAIQSAIILVFFGVIPLVWAWKTRVGGWAGAVAYLGLDRPGRGIARGIGWGLAALGTVIVIQIILGGAGVKEGNPQAELLTSIMTWPLAIALALAAGLGEELFFRGYLQRRVGWIWQAVAFGLVHLSYGTVSQVVFPFALGLFFGWLRGRGETLWALITAHFLFDFIQLGAGVLVAEHPEWLPEE